MSTPAIALRDPAWPRRLGLLLLVPIVVWPLVVASEFDLPSLFDPRSLAITGRFLATFFPPDFSADFLRIVLHATWITVATATAGLALGWVASVPLTLLASARLSQSAVGRPMNRVSAIARQLVRWLLVFLRSVPELVWALLFVRVVGLGPTAGVLAIALTYAGMLGKVYAEVLESVDASVTEGLLRNGSSRVGAFLYGSLPQCATELASYTVFRWECAVRSSVIMGFVGAGGLGQQLDMSMKMLSGAEVSTVLLMFVALVAVADRVSLWVRRTLEGD
ncbi:MAG: phosphate/phosphonate ABC transporter permease [Burkholderiaceae bacterium]